MAIRWFCMYLVLVAFLLEGTSQPIYGGKKGSADEVLIAGLVEKLRTGKLTEQQQASNLLAKFDSLPKSAIDSLTSILETGKGEGQVLAAVALAEAGVSHPGILPSLEKGLSASVWTSIPAIRAIVKLGPAAEGTWPAALQLLERGTNEQQSAVLPLISKIGRPAAALIEGILLRTKGTRNKELNAALALAQLGEHATPVIMRLLKRNDSTLDRHVLAAIERMPRKPKEALPYMLLLSQSKDGNMRKVAHRYLIEYTPPTEAVTEALWRGAEVPYHGVECIEALLERGADKNKLTELLRKHAISHPEKAGRLLIKLEPEEGMRVLRSAALRSFEYASHVHRMAANENNLIPIMEDIRALLSQPRKQVSVLRFLALVDPKHSRPAEDKVLALLLSTSGPDEGRIAAAKVLIRLNPKDKKAIARRLAELIKVPNWPIDDANLDDILDSLKRLGPDARPAVPALRTLVNSKARLDIKGKVLVAMADIDPSAKGAVLSLAQALYESKEDKLAGAFVLVYLDVPKSMDNLDKLLQAMEPGYGLTPMLRLAQVVGPKAQPIIPHLERLFASPANPLAIQTAYTLYRLDANAERATKRIVPYLDDSKELSHAMEALGNIGPPARAALPRIIAIAVDEERFRSTYSPFEALYRIDRSACLQAANERK